MNRLNQVVTSNPSIALSGTKSVAYDAIGNITSKSDVGTYSYDPARVHAVAGIVPGATGTVTASYNYDANGNLLTGRGKTIAWTSFDMVSQITDGANVLNFTYDSERNRLKQTSSDGSTKYYLNDPISGIMQEKIIGASLAVSWNDYIMVAGEMVALHVTQSTPQVRYFHKDHLGSITALTDESGSVVERNSFDAWGERRVPTGLDDPLYPALSLTSQITRGYTGHEQLDAVGLVHMNGRIYDPIIGKMMSPDPTVPDPVNQQAYNRYAYVLNNPLSLTDPTGFAPDPPTGIQAGHGNNNHGFNGTPAHQSTDFSSHEEWAAAGDLSHMLGVPLPTRADYYYAREMIRKAAILKGQIACTHDCGGMTPMTPSLPGTTLPMSATDWEAIQDFLHEQEWAGESLGHPISPFDFLSPAGPETPVLLGILGRALSNLGIRLGLKKVDRLVWDAIVPTGEVVGRTGIPRSFTLTTKSGGVYVAPNATKHLTDYAQSKLINGVRPDLVNIASQAKSQSLRDAIDMATANGITFDRAVHFGGWELRFGRPRVEGGLPALYHAIEHKWLP